MSNSGATPSSGDIFDIKRIRRLIELMNEHELTELDLRQADQRIRLRKGPEGVVLAPPAAAPADRPAAPAAVTPATPIAGSNLQVIKSPMVGTFYSSSSPETPAFVKVGDRVNPETTVCLIEAMKVFNEIPAEITGQVVAVLVDNGAPVEFGQPLFKIDPQK